MAADPAGGAGAHAFDDTIHAPVRLRISGILRHVEQVDFAVLRDTLGVTDATLSKHLRVLVEAGYATTTKTRSAGRSDARRLTWISQTPAGRAAFDAHVAELRRIADGVDGPVSGLR
ncbi:transcriptional regulator [Pseudonocardia nematodicida]|uniref:Transcriptional regulator n=1 Tax=Pseudonocardia nematodicida TaxID=1206997 RepID=A0ABV1KBD6_9PSEU